MEMDTTQDAGRAEAIRWLRASLAWGHELHRLRDRAGVTRLTAFAGARPTAPDATPPVHRVA